MQIPIEIPLRDIPHSDAVETRIREKIEKLDRFHERVMSCRGTVESPQQRKHQGKLYSVHIDMKVPGGGELVVNRMENEDIYVAIRDAFNAAARQLEDHVRGQSGEVKSHDVRYIGRVIQMFPAQGYGFIETPDRRHVYFNRNSVAQPGFDRLEIGIRVEFVEEMGNEGPQARTGGLGQHPGPG